MKTQPHERSINKLPSGLPFALASAFLWPSKCVFFAIDVSFSSSPSSIQVTFFFFCCISFHFAFLRVGHFFSLIVRAHLFECFMWFDCEKSRLQSKNCLFVDRWPNKRKSLLISFTASHPPADRYTAYTHTHTCSLWSLNRASDQTHQFRWCLRIIEAKRRQKMKERILFIRSVLCAAYNELHSIIGSAPMYRDAYAASVSMWICASVLASSVPWHVDKIEWKLARSLACTLFPSSTYCFFFFFLFVSCFVGGAVSRKLVNSTSQLMPSMCVRLCGGVVIYRWAPSNGIWCSDMNEEKSFCRFLLTAF